VRVETRPPGPGRAVVIGDILAGNGERRGSYGGVIDVACAAATTSTPWRIVIALMD
jgi:hypothetical protein